MGRRTVLWGLGGMATLTLLGCPARDANAAADRGARRMVFIIQRGAADGLSLLPPVGDPAFAGLRGELAEEEGRHKVDATFALHPAFTNVADLAQRKQALMVHAVASAHHTRSHFDAQNLLETGGSAPYQEKTGVLNRLVAMLDARGTGIAMSENVPPALRGPAASTSYAPSVGRSATADLYGRIAGMYQADPTLEAVWQRGVSTRSLGNEAVATLGDEPGQLGALTAKLMLADNAPRVAMIESAGWDTHSAQIGRLDRQVKALDAIIGALAKGMGPKWADTLVFVATEFGRTAAVNGTRGTDHGTASAAFALGGALPKTGVLADWPGLSQSALFEGRDVRPTMTMEALLSGLVGHHFADDPSKVARALYPDQSGIKPALI